MSEYMLAGSTARLLSDEKGSESLAQRVRMQPLSLVLLDEIEKAHPFVFDLLLGVLGEGRLTSSTGRSVDFRMTLIVMTSNLGTDAVRVGFGETRGTELDSLRSVREHFRPEFFNRLDHVVAFEPLSAVALRRIVELELSKLSERDGLRRRNARFAVADSAKQLLAELGYSPRYGARPLKRVIEERIMGPVAAELARHPKLRDFTIDVRCDAEGLRVGIGIP